MKSAKFRERQLMSWMENEHRLPRKLGLCCYPRFQLCRYRIRLICYHIYRSLKKWRIRVNAKSVQMTFTTRGETCPPVTSNGLKIPQAKIIKYLKLHFDHKLNWRKLIFTKQKQLGIQLDKMYWLLGNKSQLSPENKLLVQFLNLSGLMESYGARSSTQT